MNILNLCLTLPEFQNYVHDYDFGPQPPNKLVIHHTWRPTKDSWQGERTILGLKRYYEGKGWPAGPHLFIAEDGIWLFSPMRHNGIHAGPLNPLSVGIEVVGDYDFEVWSGLTKIFALGAIKLLMSRLMIPDSALFFHRDVSPKSCPGRAITKEWLFAELHGSGASEFREAVERLSVTPTPEWAREAVDFVRQHQLFDVRSEEDMRDAVKFYRFYQLIYPS